MPAIQGFSALRARSYVLRLPLFTRAIAVIILFFWLLSLPSIWDVSSWGALIPDKVSFVSGMSRSPQMLAGVSEHARRKSHLT